jgi:hypothetical protein
MSRNKNQRFNANAGSNRKNAWRKRKMITDGTVRQDHHHRAEEV